MIYWAILCFYYRCNSIYFTKESSELAIILLKNRRLGRFRGGLGNGVLGNTLKMRVLFASVLNRRVYNAAAGKPYHIRE